MPRITFFATAVFLAACSHTLGTANEADGAYLLLEIDAESLHERQLNHLTDLMAAKLRDASPAIRYRGREVLGGAARVQLLNQGDLQRAMIELGELRHSPDSNTNILAVSVAEDGFIEARLSPTYLSELTRRATAQSVEVVRRRVDPSGAGSIVVVQRNDTRILVQAPHSLDTSQLRRAIGMTGHLTFNLVREISPEDATAGRLPPGTMLAPPYPEVGAEAEVVERRPRFTGERLVRANPTADEITGQFALSFALDVEGTQVFCRITREYVGQRFAVLLDEQVLTAPRINEPICGGTGQISGDFTAQSAMELALLLNAGALPAPFVIVAEGIGRPHPNSSTATPSARLD